MLYLKKADYLRELEYFLQVTRLREADISAVEQYCDNQWETSYDVFKITAAAGAYILKKSDTTEYDVYVRLSRYDNLPVPKFYGAFCQGEDVWLVISCTEGQRPENMTDEITTSAAKALAEVANYFWNEEQPDEDTDKGEMFEHYMQQAEERAKALADYGAIPSAYDIFLRRQDVCPITMCNRDCLQKNMVWNGEKIIITNWNIGGILPYSLDIAKFIANAAKKDDDAVICMDDRQKQLFLDSYYESLIKKPERSVFDKDVQLALLNEYCELIVSGVDAKDEYFKLAQMYAQEILQNG